MKFIDREEAEFWKAAYIAFVRHGGEKPWATKSGGGTNNPAKNADAALRDFRKRAIELAPPTGPYR